MAESLHSQSTGDFRGRYASLKPEWKTTTLNAKPEKVTLRALTTAPSQTRDKALARSPAGFSNAFGPVRVQTLQVLGVCRSFCANSMASALHTHTCIHMNVFMDIFTCVLICFVFVYACTAYLLTYTDRQTGRRTDIHEDLHVHKKNIVTPIVSLTKPLAIQGPPR